MVNVILVDFRGFDTHGGNRQYGDLAHGIEATEVHQNHVDHVSAATARYAVLQEERRNTVVRPRQHGEHQHRHHHASADRQGEIAQATQAARFDASLRR